MHRSISTFAFALVTLAGCTVIDGDDDSQCGDGKCDGGEDRCEIDNAYDNGVCDTDCAQADRDCFLFFDDQPAANTWFTALENKIAMQELRPPRATLAVDDPRFQHMRELLERGWASYRKVMPVGKIDRAPELVVIDDPTPNAFVARDEASSKASWVVMVQTGAMAGQEDGPLLGVVMHELTHATKLHILEGVPERVRIHYQLRAGEAEPIGHDQRDNPTAREAITAWRTLGEDAGNAAFAELNGMPMAGSLLATVLNAAISKVDTSGCTATATNVQALNAFVGAHTNPLTSLVELATADDRAQLDQLTRAFMDELRAGCLANLSIDVFELMAEHFGVTRAEIEQKFPAAEQRAVAGLHVIDQIRYLAGDRQRRMREVASKLQETTGRDLTTLRYYTTEEEADDATIPVLRDMGLPAAGVGEFFFTLLPETARASCGDLLGASTTPPYGDLVDEHHANCWRIAHVRQLAALTDAGDSSAVFPAAAEPAPGSFRAIAGERLPRFHRASDEISHARRR